MPLWSVSGPPGAEQLRRRTPYQLKRYATADRVISDLVRMECLITPLRSDEQIPLPALRSFFSDCSVVTLHTTPDSGCGNSP
jgi:hypothetical protein